ncbi:MAG: ATP synthase subunit C [Erysipelotrichaceae bacterium]|nr:ATP synthase subunit C [Erysipelotrichaceae bacterium]MDD3924606.1 ATP synthase subunit C [Erysipelotrichaceae bacterium]MDD4643070.1 ATP synthase subunit C [Erysipelotrichaceae bacterium]
MLSLIEMFLPLIAVILVILPLFFMLDKGPKAINVKKKLIAQVSIFTGVFILAGVMQFANIKAAEEAVASITGTLAQGLGFIAAAVVTSFSAIGAGIAVAAAAPAAIGAISENSENFGKAIIFVALGEGVAIYGLLISILIINKL